MPAQQKCNSCSIYEARQETFCRVCGMELRGVDMPASNIVPLPFASMEKYCGECGCTRGNCDCLELASTA